MTPEEVWRKACAAYEDAAEEHPEMPLRDMVIAGDNAAVSVIRTAMEAYAAERGERLGEALYGLSARLLLSGFLDDAGNRIAYEKVVDEFGQPFIAANQHHGGNDADT